MLQAILLAALIAAPLGSAALFVPARLTDRGTGTWTTVRRLLLAVIGTALLAAAVALALRLLGATELIRRGAAGHQRDAGKSAVLPGGDRGGKVWRTHRDGHARIMALPDPYAKCMNRRSYTLQLWIWS